MTTKAILTMFDIAIAGLEERLELAVQEGRSMEYLHLTVERYALMKMENDIMERLVEEIERA